MGALLKSELMKIRTARLWWVLLLAGLGFVAFATIMSAFYFTTSFGGTEGKSATVEAATLLNNAKSINVFSMIAGILLIGTEFRHKTITTTLLGAPKRVMFVATKLLTSLLMGVIFAILGCAIALACTAPFLGNSKVVGSEAIPEYLGWNMLNITLYALLGAAIATLVTNQIVAIVVALVYSFVVEPLLLMILPKVWKWLPSGSAEAFSARPTDSTMSEPLDLLPLGAGLGVFLGWIALFVILGSLTSMRRDVT